MHQLITEEDIGDRTEIHAFDWRCLIELNKLDKNIKTAYLSDHTTEVMDDTEKGTWTAGLLPKDYGYSLPKMVKHLGCCWEPFEMDLTRSDLDEAHRLGLNEIYSEYIPKIIKAFSGYYGNTGMPLSKLPALKPIIA